MTTGITGVLVELWERALPAGPARRTAEILRAFRCPSQAQSVESMTLAERDRELLRIRRALFGDRFSAVMSCSTCGERLQMEFSAADMQSGREASASDAADMRELSSLRVNDGISLQLRAPTLSDLLAAADTTDPEAAGEIIVRRCIRAAENQGVAVADLSPEVLEAAAAQLEHLEARSRFTLEMQCPGCHRTEDHALDLGHYLWNELQTEVLRVLREVAQLARGFGWRETDILAMTPLRRRLYLGMLPS